MKYKLIEDEIYGEHIHLYQGKGVVEFLKRKKTAKHKLLAEVIEIKDSEAHGFYLNNNTYPDTVLYISGRRVDTVSHELLHHTFQVMRDVGIRLSKSSEEAFTYYHGYMLNKVLKAIREK